VCGTRNPGFSSNAKLNHDYCRGCETIQPFVAFSRGTGAEADGRGAGIVEDEEDGDDEEGEGGLASEKVQDPVCGRFPASPVCGCTIPCRKAAQEVTVDRVADGVYIGPVQAAYVS
jgi:hypothetical protein